MSQLKAIGSPGHASCQYFLRNRSLTAASLSGFRTLSVDHRTTTLTAKKRTFQKTFTSWQHVLVAPKLFLANRHGCAVVRNFSVSSAAFNAEAPLPLQATIPTAELGLSEAVAATDIIQPPPVSVSNGLELDYFPEKPSEAVASTDVIQPPPVNDSKELVLDFLPEKPAPIPSSGGGDVESTIHFIGDPPFDSLGLASMWPPGRIQYLMEQVHTSLDIPWWGTIMITTAIMRLLVFPLVIKSQRNAALMNNYMPQVQALQQKMTDARRRGDMYDSQRYGMELQTFMKEKQINPLKNMLPIMVQMPIFMSMFIGLRGMANLPVESLSRGGLLWFDDLTLADPFYVLPLITSASLYLQIKLGADGANLNQVGALGKIAMKAMPLILFPLTMSFPSAVTFYWATTNLISILQARLVRVGGVREMLGIPKMKKWDHDKLPIKEKGFKETIRESVDNWKVQADIADRRGYDEQAFREAGLGKPKRTYKFDPTKTKRPDA